MFCTSVFAVLLVK